MLVTQGLSLSHATTLAWQHWDRHVKSLFTAKMLMLAANASNSQGCHMSCATNASMITLKWPCEMDKLS